MQGFKKVLCVLMAMTIVMLTMFQTSVAKAGQANMKQAEYLYNMGLFQGTSATKFVPDLNRPVERQEAVMMVIRMFGLEDVSRKATLEQATGVLAKRFKDAADVADWAKNAVAYAAYKGIIKGYPGKTFEPKSIVSGREYCQMIMNQLGYVGDEYKFDEIVSAFKDIGGISETQAGLYSNGKALIRDDVVGISFGALMAPYRDSGTKLINELVSAGIVTSEAASKNVSGYYEDEIWDPEEGENGGETEEEPTGEPTVTGAPEPTQAALPAISSVSVVNGSITVSLSNAPGTVANSDFSVSQYVYMGTATIPITTSVSTSVAGYTYETSNNGTATLTISPVLKAIENQSICYDVSYKGGAKVRSNSITIDGGFDVNAIKGVVYGSLEVRNPVLDGATGVSPSVTIQIICSGPIKDSTVNSNTVRLFTVSDNVMQVMDAPTLSGDKKSIVFKKAANSLLSPNTQYKLIVSGSITSEGGTTLGSDRTATFTVGEMVSLTGFQNNDGVAVDYSCNIASKNVQNGSKVYLIFDRNIDASTVNSSHIRLRNIVDTNAEPEPIGLGLDPQNNKKVWVAFQTPSGLVSGKTYELSFTGLVASNGSAVADGTWRFVANGMAPQVSGVTLASGEDITTKSVSNVWGRTTPGSTQDGVNYNGLQFNIAFNTPIDESTIPANIKLATAINTNTVPTNYTYDSVLRRVVLTPTGNLSEQTMYMIQVTKGLKATSGVPLSSDYTSGYITTLDAVAPTCTKYESHNFSNLPTGSASEIQITFNEPIKEYNSIGIGSVTDPSVSASTSFTAVDSITVVDLTDNTVMDVAPAVRMSQDYKTMYISVTPSTSEAGHTIQVTLNSKEGGSGAYICDNFNTIDAKKNSISSKYAFTFTVISGDTGAPRVLKVIPRLPSEYYAFNGTPISSGVTGLNADNDIYILFSEYMAGIYANKATCLDNATGNVQLWKKPVGTTSWIPASLQNTDIQDGRSDDYVWFNSDYSNNISYIRISEKDIAPNTRYKLVISPSANANGIEDAAGNDLIEEFALEFTTAGTLAWNPVSGLSMMSEKFKNSVASTIYANTGTTAGEFKTASEMYDQTAANGVQTNDVLAIKMGDGSYFFTKVVVGSDNSTIGAGSSLSESVPSEVAAGATVINMADRGSSIYASEKDVPITASIAIKLEGSAEANINDSTVNSNTILLVKVSPGGTVTYTLTKKVIDNNMYILIKPDSSLAPGTVYELQVVGVKDALDNVIASKTLQFTTAGTAQ